MNLRSKTAAALLATALVPLIAFGVIAFEVQHDRITDDALERLSAIAAVQEDRVDAAVDGAQARIDLIASRTQLRLSLSAAAGGDEAEQARMETILVDAMEASDEIVGIAVFDVDDRSVVRVGRDPAVGGSRDGRGPFEVSDDGELLVSTAPLELDGRLVGWLMVTMEADFLRRATIDYTGLGDSGETVLAERLDDGVARFLNPLRFDAAAPSNRIIEAGSSLPIVGALAGEERVFRHADDYRGAEVLAVSRHVDRTGWGMVVKIDRAEALAAVARFRDMLVAGSVLVAAVVLALSIWASRRIADPVEALTAELEQRGTELEEANAALEQQMRKLEQFAYATSHDLQEPLRSITGFVQLLERHLGEDLDERARQYMDFVNSGAERLRQLIEDLLAYSRAEGVEVEPEPIDLNREVEEILASLTTAVDEAGAGITVEQLPTIAADPRLIRPLLQNLLTNALKFRHPNGPGHRVEVSAASVDGGWEITVADNGIGIDPTYRERVFGIFQRLHTREEYPGTGIGLAICQTAVEHHGGAIRVEDGIDGGAAFVVFLPQE